MFASVRAYVASAIIGTTAGGSLGLACTKQEVAQVQSALSPLVACEVNELLGSGIEDPAQLLTGCAGSALSSLLMVATDLLQDATGLSMDAGMSATQARLPLPMVQHLQRTIAALIQYQSEGGLVK